MTGVYQGVDTGGGAAMKISEMFDLSGKTALVTGGGRGLGESMAWALAEAGAAVAVASRGVDECQIVADQIRETTGQRTLARALDLSQVESVKQVVQEIEASLGPIDILINNSGTSWGMPFEELPLDKWEKVISVNVNGTFMVTQSVIGGMRERGWGRIVNIASLAGLRGTDPRVMQATGYHASKGAVIAMTRDLAVKYAKYNVLINAIAPGFIPTKLSRGVIGQAESLILSHVPMGRLGNVEDIKGLAVFLSSEACRYITGQVIALDGGATAL